jgi:hypothetical protein
MPPGEHTRDIAGKPDSGAPVFGGLARPTPGDISRLHSPDDTPLSTTAEPSCIYPTYDHGVTAEFDLCGHLYICVLLSVCHGVFMRV